MMGSLEPAWRKSSRSYANGNCAEVACWRKSSFCASGECAEIGAWRRASLCNGGACVEAGSGDAVVGVRDSQLGDASPVLVFSGGAWERFTAALKAA